LREREIPPWMIKRWDLERQRERGREIKRDVKSSKRTVIRGI